MEHALGPQLQQRGHAVRCITPTELECDFAAPSTAADDAEEHLVIDCVSRQFAANETPVLSEQLFARLIGHCQQRQKRLILLSDSRVFPSGNKQRYRESDSVRTSSAPGLQLAQREHYVREHLPQHIILRSGPLIASSGSNLLTELLRLFRAGGVVPVSSEPRFCPTPAADIARVVSGIYDQLDCAAQCWGTYHYHSSDAASSYEFAEVLLAAAAQYWDVGGNHVQLLATAEHPLGGLFPILNCQHIRDTFGIQQLPWRKVIPQMLKIIYAGESP